MALRRLPGQRAKNAIVDAMTNVRKTLESDETGTIHVDMPVGAPGRRVEVIVTWAYAAHRLARRLVRSDLPLDPGSNVRAPSAARRMPSIGISTEISTGSFP